MKFQYIVKRNIVHYKSDGTFEFDNDVKVFNTKTQIENRQDAFNYYHNFMHALLLSYNIDYNEECYEDYSEELKHKLTDPIQGFKINDKFILTGSIDLGIGVFVELLEDFNGHESGELFPIFGQGKFHRIYDIENIVYSLRFELELYEKFNIDSRGYTTFIEYCDRAEWEEGHYENEPSFIDILSTPYDWSTYSKPYWWDYRPFYDEIIYKEGSFTYQYTTDIIRNGENKQVEFKPTLLYNFNTQKGGIGIKSIIAKTIASFMNTDGGLLLIGVNDNAEITGLDFDFQLANGKNPKDFFRLEFDQMMGELIGKPFMHLVELEFETIDHKDIAKINVSPSYEIPVFVKDKKTITEKSFYVRSQASSQLIENIDEIVQYLYGRFRNKYL